MPNLLRAALLAVICVMVGSAPPGLASHGTIGPAAFLAQGVCLGFLVVWGTALWPGAFAGLLALGLLTGVPVGPALAMAAVNTGLAVLGAVLLRRLDVSSDLARPRDALALIALITLLLQPLWVVLGTPVLRLGGRIFADDWPSAWSSSWLASSIGLCVAASVVLTWASPWGPPQPRWSERALWGALTLIVPAVVWSLPGPAATIQALAFAATYPIIAGVADRTGPRGASLALLTVCVSTAAAAHFGVGQFAAAADPSAAVLRLDLYLAGAVLVGLPLAALSAEDHRLRAALQTSNATLAELSARDPLTGLVNRRAFDATLTAEWNRALRVRGSLGLLMVDIDHFKKFNDQYGHPRGDECLRAVADLLSARARRSGDLVARYGGEEFAVVVPGADPAGLATLAEAIRRDVAEAAIPHVAVAAGVVTISVGAATADPDPDHAVASLLDRADQALYRAKGEGRNRVALD